MITQIGASSAAPDHARREPPPPPHRISRSRNDQAGTFARHWLMILLIAAAATALAWFAAALQPKGYRATAIAGVVPLTQTLTPQEILRSVDSLERRVVVSSLAALAGTPETRQRTRAGDAYTIEALVLPNTSLFRIEVEGPNPARAAAIANEVPRIIAGHARTLYGVYGVAVVSEASAPVKPATPRLVRALAAGLAFGLLLGLAAAWLLDRRT